MTATVAIVGQKGGSGKSTLAISLAAEWDARGQKTLLVDCDPQGSSLTWNDIASDRGVPGPTVVGMGDAIRTRLPNILGDHELVVIDCPPKNGKRTVGALMVADLALVPCKPSPMDLWALQDTLDIIEQAQGLRPELEVRIVFNQVQRSSTLSREVGQVLDDLSLSRMETSLPYRAELMRTLASGQGVTVSKPSHNASYEVRRWVDEVQEILGSDGHPWGMQ